MENATSKGKPLSANLLTRAKNGKQLELMIQEQARMIYGFETNFDEMLGFLTDFLTWTPEHIEHMKTNQTICSKYRVVLEVEKYWENGTRGKSKSCWSLGFSIMVLGYCEETNVWSYWNYDHAFENNDGLFTYFGLDVQDEIKQRLPEFEDLFGEDTKYYMSAIPYPYLTEEESYL